MIHVHIQKIYHTTPYWVSFAQIYFLKCCLAAGLVWLISWESLVFKLWKVFNTLWIVSFKRKMAALASQRAYVSQPYALWLEACWWPFQPVEVVEDACFKWQNQQSNTQEFHNNVKWRNWSVVSLSAVKMVSNHTLYMICVHGPRIICFPMLNLNSKYIIIHYIQFLLHRTFQLACSLCGTMFWPWQRWHHPC